MASMGSAWLPQSVSGFQRAWGHLQDSGALFTLWEKWKMNLCILRDICLSLPDFLPLGEDTPLSKDG